jgi:hypothetical protein
MTQGEFCIVPLRRSDGCLCISVIVSTTEEASSWFLLNLSRLCLSCG